MKLLYETSGQKIVLETHKILIMKLKMKFNNVFLNIYTRLTSNGQFNLKEF
jgi:hypothetical protein